MTPQAIIEAAQVSRSIPTEHTISEALNSWVPNSEKHAEFFFAITAATYYRGEIDEPLSARMTGMSTQEYDTDEPEFLSRTQACDLIGEGFIAGLEGQAAEEWSNSI